MKLMMMMMIMMMIMMMMSNLMLSLYGNTERMERNGEKKSKIKSDLREGL